MLRKLDEFFMGSKEQTGLAFLRVCVGLCLFLQYISLIDKVQLLWGPSGFTGENWRAHVPWATAVARESALSFQVPVLFSSSAFVWIMYGGLLVSSFLLLLGWRTRWVGIVALALHCLFHSQNEFILWGWGAMIKPFLLYVILARADEWYSLNSWLRERRIFPTKPWVGSVWPLRLVQVHLTAVYIVVAYTRLTDPNWLNGSMLYGILTDQVFSRIDSDWVFAKDFLRVLCYGSWGLELAAPFLLWWRRSRKIAVIFLVLMHVGLEVLTMVGYWNLLILGALSCFYFDQKRDFFLSAKADEITR